MVTDSTDAKKYEIAYLISPAVPEDDVARLTGQITKTIEDAKGVVRHIEEPKRRKLAYRLENDRFAYFGWTTFTIDRAAIAEINKKLKFEKEIMRYLLAEEAIEPPRRDVMRSAWRPSGEGAPVEIRAPKREAEAAAPATEAEREAAIESIDKKLDEILGE